MATFKEWLVSEWSDIFGFEKPPRKESTEKDYDGPIMPIKAEMLIETMMKENLRGQEPFSAYADQIQWGRSPGAIRMVISPLGSFKSIVRRLQLNLEGKEVWVCKSIIPYKDLMHSNLKFDENFAMDLFEKIERISEDQIEVPDREYRGLRDLTVALAHKCRMKNTMPSIFVFTGVKEMKEDRNYLIEFECRGHGVETPGSARVERFVIDMSYNPKTGMIKSFGHDVQSPTKGHRWYPQPSEWEEYFSPNQKREEIIEAISSAFKTY